MEFSKSSIKMICPDCLGRENAQSIPCSTCDGSGLIVIVDSELFTNCVPAHVEIFEIFELKA